MKIIDGFGRIMEGVSRWLGYVCSAMIIVLMFTIVADVIGRYFGHPVVGDAEMARLMMIVVVFPALAWAAFKKVHVRVDLVMERFPPHIQIIFEIITLFIALGMYGILTWKSYERATQVDNATSMLQIPLEPFYWIMAVGFSIFCLSIVVLVLQSILKAVKR